MLNIEAIKIWEYGAVSYTHLRAKNVTISALRTATIVASALYNQKIVLKKIDLLNKTTNDLISGTSKMLKEQGTEIQRQSIESNISVDTLKSAFSDTLEALNAISSYKQEALPRLKAVSYTHLMSCDTLSKIIWYV